jgi:hypothetical protein
MEALAARKGIVEAGGPRRWIASLSVWSWIFLRIHSKHIKLGGQRTTNTVTYIDNKIKYSIIFLRNMLLFHFINKAITLVQNLRSTNNKYSYLYRQQDKILHYISLKYAFIPFYK